MQTVPVETLRRRATFHRDRAREGYRLPGQTIGLPSHADLARKCEAEIVRRGLPIVEGEG